MKMQQEMHYQQQTMKDGKTSPISGISEEGASTHRDGEFPQGEFNNDTFFVSPQIILGPNQTKNSENKNPYLLNISKDLKTAYNMFTRREIHNHFQYDHRMLIPKKTYMATKKTFISNYRRCVKNGEAGKSSALNIGQASIGMRYHLPEDDIIAGEIPGNGTINEKRKSTILADNSTVGEEDQISGNEDPVGVPNL